VFAVYLSRRQTSFVCRTIIFFGIPFHTRTHNISARVVVLSFSRVCASLCTTATVGNGTGKRRRTSVSAWNLLKSRMRLASLVVATPDKYIYTVGHVCRPTIVQYVSCGSYSPESGFGSLVYFIAIKGQLYRLRFKLTKVWFAEFARL